MFSFSASFLKPGSGLLHWDENFFSQLNILCRNEFFDWLMPFISLRLPWIVLLILLGGYFFWRHRPENWSGIALRLLCVLICIGATETITNISKDVIGRPRPANAVLGARHYADEQWETVTHIEEPATARDSFYSAHAANSAVFAVAMALFFPKLRPWIFFIPLIVGYARIYMGRHYPLDIIGGWLVGSLMAWLFCWLFLYAEKHDLLHLPGRQKKGYKN